MRMMKQRIRGTREFVNANRRSDDPFELIGEEFIEAALKDLKQKRDAAARKKALDWFNARTTDVFGYGSCLAYCGFNPNTIRRIINRLVGAGEGSDHAGVRT